jgi:putative membrane protein
MLRIILAWLHLVALAIGFAAVTMRASALRVRPLTPATLRRAFAADAFWGVAAILWLVTGLWRLLAPTEKDISYYMQNGAFHAKMGLFLLVLLLELWPMITMIRWRRSAARGGASWVPPEAASRRVARISTLEAFVVLLIVLAANLMARGVGA